jgi:hypothetical protein
LAGSTAGGNVALQQGPAQILPCSVIQYPHKRRSRPYLRDSRQAASRSCLVSYMCGAPQSRLSALIHQINARNSALDLRPASRRAGFPAPVSGETQRQGPLQQEITPQRLHWLAGLRGLELAEVVLTIELKYLSNSDVSAQRYESILRLLNEHPCRPMMC